MPKCKDIKTESECKNAFNNNKNNLVKKCVWRDDVISSLEQDSPVRNKLQRLPECNTFGNTAKKMFGHRRAEKTADDTQTIFNTITDTLNAPFYGMQASCYTNPNHPENSPDSISFNNFKQSVRSKYHQNTCDNAKIIVSFVDIYPVN